MSIFSTLDVSHNVCFESIANRRRFNYSGVISHHGESLCTASSSIGCDKPDRFLPMLTSNMPLHTTQQTSRYAAELLAAVDPIYQPPLYSGASSDPTLLSRLYYSQSLNVNVPVPSPYSALHNASSRPAHVIASGSINEWPLHPCAWSCQNIIAVIIRGAVYTYTCKDRSWDIIEGGVRSATSLEWLTDHTLVIGDKAGTVVVKDINTGLETMKWRVRSRPPVEGASVSSLSFSKEHHLLAAGRSGGDLTLYDLRVNRREHLAELLTAGISTVRWSPVGRCLAVGGRDGNVTCVDLAAHKISSLKLPNQKQPPHKGFITSLAWAPQWDPHLLATGGTGKDGMVHLWSLSGSDKSSRPYRHLQTCKFSVQVSSMHFAPHVGELLTCGNPLEDAIEAPRTTPPPPRGILVHQYPSFKRVHAVNAHKGPIVDSVLSAAGTSLLTFGKDERLKTWRIWGERKKERSQTMMDRLGIIR